METPNDLYLDLLKRILVNSVYEDDPFTADEINIRFFTKTEPYDRSRREFGMDLPRTAHTMVGRRRLDNVHECLEKVVADDVPGDLIETGVWRGGVCIFMRGFLAAAGITDRTVWVADSFEGVPEVGPGGHEFDVRLNLHTGNGVLAVPEETVRANFVRYGLLDDQVRFLPGWFADTLPAAPVERLALLRLDGDLHVSTHDALTHLYPRLSPGGFVIIDDYAIRACRTAVHDYRDAHGITEPVEMIDSVSAFWRRTA